MNSFVKVRNSSSDLFFCFVLLEGSILQTAGMENANLNALYIALAQARHDLK